MALPFSCRPSTNAAKLFAEARTSKPRQSSLVHVVLCIMAITFVWWEEDDRAGVGRGSAAAP